MRRLLKGLLPAVAVVFLFSLATAAGAAEMKGKIKQMRTDLDRKEFVVVDAKGKAWTFRTVDAVLVRINDRHANFQDLRIGDEVTVIYAKDGDLLTPGKIFCHRTGESK